MPQFCRFCGGELRNPKARFCPVCGQERATGPVTDGVEAMLAQRNAAPAEATPVTMPRLIIRLLGQPPYELTLTETTVTIGRAPSNGLVLPSPYVSGYHGRLESQGTQWQYVDLGSTNGTFLNGRRVQSAVLNHGDILRIGDLQGNSASLTFMLGASTALQGPQSMGSLVLAPEGALTLGRDPQSGIPLQAPLVSWRHASITAGPRGSVLTDLNSTNGTFVNGQRIERPYLLRERDVVQIGPFSLVYSAGKLQQYVAAGGVRLDGVQLVREVGKGERTKRILDDISLTIHPREFVALVGTSGAGKSTLMKALSGVVRAQQGQVLVNGDDLYQQFDLYRTMIGYVPQDDIIHKDLTVLDVLRYAAQLRLPPDTTAAELEQRVEQVLQDVGMGGQSEQVVSSLSGGQRKRVSIAVELLAEPRLFFLDEPTSGLDPGLEKKMMYTLRHLADGGRTVVLVTHATANISQCDHVCFLAHGRLAYFGPPEEAFTFFEVATGDFSDVYDQLDDSDPQRAYQKAVDWEKRYRESDTYRRYVAQRQQRVATPAEGASDGEAQTRGSKVNPLRQLAVLTRRYLKLVLRDRVLLAVLLAVMPLVGGLILLVAGPQWLQGDTLGEIERQLAAELATGASSATYSIVTNSLNLLFLLAFAGVLLGLFASGYEIVKERSIYRRERMVTVRIAPYLLSKVLVIGTFALLQCGLLLLVIALKIRLPAMGVFLPAPVEMFITLFLATLAAIHIGLFISVLVPNTNTVIYILFMLLFFQLIFTGTLFELPGATKELSALTLTRWTLEGLGGSVDMDRLSGLSRTRVHLDPMTAEVAFDVEKPAADWEPVTVITATQLLEVQVQPGITQTIPISVPEVMVHELRTVTETVRESVTIEAEPVDIVGGVTFGISYARTTAHLLRVWGILAIFSLVFGLGTAWVLRRQDVR
ncbi:MAG: FHA domain-containing protein [Anaerolineae bacterium]|jgi:ABC-type multidrug transport system ATPase subunit/pSer/pThr/pTyr-binding forkhead associated (FHA) protein|nr:FHA domain-containing protein [Anaerolineae bacterium]